MGHLQPAQAQGAAFPEVFHGKQLGVGGAVDKRIGIVPPAIGFGQGAARGHGAQHATRPVGRLPGCRRRALKRVVQRGCFTDRHGARIGCDKNAQTLARRQVAVVHQLLVGRGHGVAAQAQQLGQITGRRQGRAGCQAFFKNGLHHGQPKAGMQGQPRLRLKLKQLRPLNHAET